MVERVQMQNLAVRATWIFSLPGAPPGRSQY